MNVRCVVVLSLVSTAIFAGPALAQDADQPQQVVTAEPLETTPATTPVTTPKTPLGVAIQSKLGNEAKGDEYDRADQEALKAFYEAGDFAPVWVGDNGLNAKAKAAIAEIRKADDWGLDAGAFALPDDARASQASANPESLADTEVTLSLAVLKYARHARGGRIMDPAGTLSSYLDRTPQLLEPKVVIEKIASADEADAYLRGLHPQHPQFEKLRQAYLAMRDGARAQERVTIPGGRMLVPGQSDENVAILRKRLEVPAPQNVTNAEGETVDEAFFDDTLKEAVMAFQKENGLSPDGLVGSGTRAALNNFEVLSNDKLLANMEQWRWMPEDLGSVYVWLNIPEYKVRISKNDEIIHEERAITGLVSKQTPVFSDIMKMVVFRPRWNVPNSIKVRELYPSLARGGSSFNRQGLRLSRNGRVINPASVDWSVSDIRNFDVYQPPGRGNALGLVKFSFPNKHLVYMHDTPTKHLFDQTRRAYSHGCMRIRNPDLLAEILLKEDKGWDAGQVDDLMENGPDNNEVELDHQFPVHVTYFTAWVDENGETQTAPDVYGHEKRIKLALEGQWQRIAKGPNHLAPVKLSPSMRANYNNGWGWGGNGGSGRKRTNSVGDYVQSVLGSGF